MNQNVYLKQYKKNNIETATPEELFMLLFNALVNFIAKAKTAMIAKNIEDTHNNIVKAQNILIEFIETLDFNENPELAKNLKNLYQYNISLLLRANMKKDIAAIDESFKMLQDLRNTWKQAVDMLKTQKAQALSADVIDNPNASSHNKNLELMEENNRYDFDG